MKKLILILVILITNIAQADCFLAQEKDKFSFKKENVKPLTLLLVHLILL